MTAQNMVGPIVVASQIENALKNLLVDRLDFYMSEVADVLGYARNVFPHVGDVDVDTDFDKWPEKQLPYVVVTSPGMNDAPVKEGSTYDGNWAFGVVVVAAAQDRPSASETAKAWAAGVRTCVVQHGSLGGVASGVTLGPESYDDTPADGERTLAIAAVRLVVTVKDIVDAAGLPNFTDEVLGHPDHHVDPGPSPVVTETDLSVQNTPID